MTTGTLLVLIGIILILLSAFTGSFSFFGDREHPRPISLWNLGWAFVLAGLLLFGQVRPF